MLCLTLAVTLGYQADDTSQQIEFLRVSYKANKDAFAYGTFHFEFTRGGSASFADAEAEVFSKAFEERGYYVFDGENARYELVADPKVLAAATKRTSERASTSSITAFRMLTDGRVTLRDNLSMDRTDTFLQHSAIVFAGTEAFYKPDDFEFPLHLGDKGGGACDLFSGSQRGERRKGVAHGARHECSARQPQGV